MKKCLYVFIIILFTLLILSCPNLSGLNSSKQTKVGISLATSDMYQLLFDDFMNKASVYNCEIIVENANNDIETQNSHIESLIKQKIQVLIIHPVDNTSPNVASLLAKAKDKGITVINFITPIVPNSDVSLYVGFDNTEIGRKMGRTLLSAWPKGNYWLFKGDANDNSTEQFYSGTIEILQPKVNSKDIKITYGPVNIESWSPDYAGTLASAEIVKGSPVDAVLAPNDYTSGAIIGAFENAGLPIPYITGQDGDLSAFKRIISGKQGMTIFKNYKLAVDIALDTARKLGTGVSPEECKNFTNTDGTNAIPACSPDLPIITASNIDELIIAKGYYTHEDIYGY